MKINTKFVLLLVATLVIVIGSIVFSADLFSLGNKSAAVVLMFAVIIVGGIISVFMKRCYYDIKTGIPSDDERTKKVRNYAAGYAYFISLYVWILLLAFKRYLDNDDLLMIGLFGMLLSFYISWLIFNRKTDIE